MKKKVEEGLVVKCTLCGEKLDQAGALIFSPPIPGEKHESVQKYHICFICWTELVDHLKEQKKRHGQDGN